MTSGKRHGRLFGSVGSIFLLGALLLIDTLSADAADDFSSSALDIVDWIQGQEGGAFNSKQDIRLDAKQRRLGIFAKERIEEGEVLSQIPWGSIIAPKDDEDEEEVGIYEELDCDTVNLVLQEMNKVENEEGSEYGPYVKYLLEQIAVEPIPSVWSDNGKMLLVEILGGMEQQIPPGGAVDMIDTEWFLGCGADENDTFAEDVAGLVKKFAIYDVLVPLLDLYRHRNANYFNVRTELVRGVHYRVIANRTIEAGEQIYNSYDMCEECNPDAVDSGYGTPEIFRDYGFIEDLPQRWSFQPGAVDIDDGEDSWVYAPEQIQFELVEGQDSGTMEAVWADFLLIDDRARNYIRRLFRKELRRLYRFNNVLYDMENSKGEDGNPGIPANEWEKVQDFYSAIVTALRHAIRSMVNDGDDEIHNTCTEGMSGNEGVCPAVLVDEHGIHYDDLGYEGDHLEYIFPTCADSQLVQFYNYEDLEKVKTNYQNLSFWQHPETLDVCMNLENTLQICSNYRPHYHEFFVHFPARYLESVKRVIFIGGGDSMLLHEVLKYPTLEKVVGLELDQQVTRKSFKYFKSQPHFDKDNVEWWYGDATKSLPLLPQDYWGSFDLVLVDLSETVMSFSVTGELDIFAALSLLLKPEGIMVKNEPYIEQFSQFFDYSIHIFYGSPKICTQVLVMGSNKVDFLHHPLKEHDVERVLLETLEEQDGDGFKYFHDYRKTDARSQGKCKDDDVTGGNTTTAHGKKAGILDIVDAGDASIPLNRQRMREILYSVARTEGLTPVSTPSSSVDSSYEGSTEVMVMKEGYVVARMWPESNYCAFDVNLWGSFQKSESLKAALVKAVDSSSVSSFRIVVGGMQGSSTWEEDKDVIGIQIAQTRNCEVESSTSNAQGQEQISEDQVVSIAMEQTSHFTGDEASVVAVVCGFETMKGQCLGLDVFEKHKKTHKVIPVWTCPYLKGVDTESMEYSNMYKCEQSVLDSLEEALDENEKISIFVFDSSAPYEMAQIFASIWGFSVNRDDFLEAKHLFLSHIPSSKPDEWRRNFLERYRQENHKLPLSRVELILKSANTSFEFGILSTNDRYFFKNLSAFEKSLEKQLVTRVDGQIEVEVKSVTGGVHYFDPEYDSETFPPEAYDANPARVQAAAQRPMGRQTIQQFETSNQNEPTSLTLSILGFSLEKALEKVNLSTTKVEAYTDVGDGGIIVSSFADGGVVLVWDGKYHVDINMFSSNQEQAQADLFVTTFASLSSLQQTLRDDQPRGTGRVVQFQSEINLSCTGIGSEDSMCLE